MRGNVRCHTARLQKDMLEMEKIQLMDWPASYPDLYMIQNNLSLCIILLVAQQTRDNKYPFLISLHII